jgi:hypothetical protein
MKNTLHICFLEAVNNIQDYCHLLEADDSIVFICQDLSKQQYQHIKQLFAAVPVYFIVNSSTHEIDTISYDYWVSLCDSYHKTFTWK